MRILVTGPESSGKSTLSRALAWSLDGTYVAEEARAYLHELGHSYTEADLPRIWQRQLRAERRAVASGASYIICDTGPEVIRVWSEVKYGRCAPEVLQASQHHAYDLTLLCYPDLEWSYDPLREAPDQTSRLRLYARYRNLLPDAHLIQGSGRVASALAAVSQKR